MKLLDTVGFPAEPATAVLKPNAKAEDPKAYKASLPQTLNPKKRP